MHKNPKKMNIYTSYKAVTKWLQNKDKKKFIFFEKNA
jgi:hypothetical protein